MRTIGASVGISIVRTLVTRETQVNWNELFERALHRRFRDSAREAADRDER